MTQTVRGDQRFDAKALRRKLGRGRAAVLEGDVLVDAMKPA
jgi:hypothetical protein